LGLLLAMGLGHGSTSSSDHALPCSRSLRAKRSNALAALMLPAALRPFKSKRYGYATG
jgi:hypothetical protein